LGEWIFIRHDIHDTATTRLTRMEPPEKTVAEAARIRKDMSHNQKVRDSLMLLKRWPLLAARVHEMEHANLLAHNRREADILRRARARREHREAVARIDQNADFVAAQAAAAPAAVVREPAPRLWRADALAAAAPAMAPAAVVEPALDDSDGDSDVTFGDVADVTDNDEDDQSNAGASDVTFGDVADVTDNDEDDQSNAGDSDVVVADNDEDDQSNAGDSDVVVADNDEDDTSNAAKATSCDDDPALPGASTSPRVEPGVPKTATVPVPVQPCTDWAVWEQRARNWRMTNALFIGGSGPIHWV